MVRNDPNLYTLGAVQLDSTPSVNLYAQLMAKKQAKEDAIDDYYKKLPSTLNSAGMRDQSIPGFNQAIGEYQKYWMENKDKIRKGNTPEAFNADKMFREIQQKVNEDKNAAKTDLELGKMRFNKENGYIFEDPDFIKTQSQHSLSVFDPNHKAMDLGTVTLPTAPFDETKQDKLWGSVTKGLNPGKVYDYSKQYTNPKTGQVIVPFAKVFNPTQVEQIADQAAKLVKDDKSARVHFQKILDSPNSDGFEELQKAYSKVFHGIVDTPEKAAAADAIIRASVPQEVGEEQESNFQQKQQAAINKIYIQDGLIRDRRVGSGGGATIEGNEFDRLPTPKVGRFTGNKTLRPDQIPAQTQAILKSAGIDIDGAVSFDVEEKDGKIESITPYYEYTKADKTTEIKKDKTIYRKDMENAQLKYNTEPQKGDQPKFGEGNSPKPNGRTYKYNGKTFSQEKIEKAAKQSGLTVDEYIKKYGIK